VISINNGTISCVVNEQDEVVEEKVTALLPSNVLSGLADSNWKERLTAVEKMTDVCLCFVANIAEMILICIGCFHGIMFRKQLNLNKYFGIIVYSNANNVCETIILSVFNDCNGFYCTKELRESGWTARHCCTRALYSKDCL